MKVAKTINRPLSNGIMEVINHKAMFTKRLATSFGKIDHPIFDSAGNLELMQYLSEAIFFEFYKKSRVIASVCSVSNAGHGFT